jgi:hypothetical protein
MTDKSEGEALLDRIGLRFQSGNSVPVERATITRAEYEALRASPQPSEPAAPVEVLGDVYGAVWSALIEAGADVGSARKAAEKAAELARTANPEPAAAEPVASRCPDCRGSGWLQEGVNAMVTRQIECHRCKGKGLIYTAPPSASAPSQPSELQAKVAPWMQECFGPVISADKLERSDRFIEESLELVQACGYERERAHALVEYVFNRPVGEPSQEVGGVMVTLAALCLAHGMDMHAAGETEVRRISAPDVIAKIRAKQASKPTGSALPISQLSEGPSRVTELLVEWGGTPNHNLTRRDAIEWCDRFAAALAAAEGKGNG